MKRSRSLAHIAVCALPFVLFWGSLTANAWAQEGDVYGGFNKFCIKHFGAEKEEEVYRAFGKELKLVEGSLWRHVSESSACIAWETNLPAKTFVEYGTTTRYGQKTPEPERPFSLHVHHLKDLKPNATCHYRLVAVDERGNQVASKDMTLTTRRLANAVRIPDDLRGPPFVLDRANTTYLVTKDIAADGTAIFIAASGITLDLGGHTITYDQRRDTSDEGACGVRGHKTRGIGLRKITVVNGTVVQGDGNSSTRRVWDTLYNPIFFKGSSELEFAGVTIHYRGRQVVAIALIMGAERSNIHHNVFLDKGTSLFNRHIGMDAIALSGSDSKCHHNLIKRTRHRGIKATSNNEFYANEIYIDSFATNSYGIMYYSPKGGQNLALHHNRIFGTGYHPVGIGSGQGFSNVRIYANYIQMQGTEPRGRWTAGQGGGDPRGQVHPVNGIRLQRPGRNIDHYGNIIVAKGSGEGGMMRCLWLVPGERSGPNLAFRNNRVKLIAEDRLAQGYAIAACGAGEASRSSVVKLIGNTVISNLCHVQFGDNYGHGGKHVFASNRLIKVGDDPRYRTIRLGWRGWRYESYGHTFIDTDFEGGAGYDSVSFDGAGRARYDFAVGWSLEIKASPGAEVSIKDNTGAQVFSSQVPQGGKLTVPLTQYIRTRDGKSMRTPHTVTVEKNGKTVTKQVTMDKAKSIQMRP